MISSKISRSCHSEGVAAFNNTKNREIDGKEDAMEGVGEEITFNL